MNKQQEAFEKWYHNAQIDTFNFESEAMTGCWSAAVRYANKESLNIGSHEVYEAVMFRVSFLMDLRSLTNSEKSELNKLADSVEEYEAKLLKSK